MFLPPAVHRSGLRGVRSKTLSAAEDVDKRATVAVELRRVFMGMITNKDRKNMYKAGRKSRRALTLTVTTQFLVTCILFLSVFNDVHPYKRVFLVMCTV